MERCRTCKNFTPEREPYGRCERWNVGYGTDVQGMPLDEVLVENDEGWGMVVGPDFGCVLHYPKN